MYKNCSEIPMHNFNAIRVDEDYRWLMVEFTGYNEVNIPTNASAIFYEIINEYCEKDGDRKALELYELMADISFLELRQKIVDALLETLCYLDDNKPEPIIKELKHWDMPFNIKNDFKIELKEMERLQRAFNSKIGRKKMNLEEFDTDDEGITLLEQKLALESLLNKNNIDLKKIVADEWIAIKKLGKRTSDLQLKWQKHN